MNLIDYLSLPTYPEPRQDAMKLCDLFDPKCLDLARHFYPDYPEDFLRELAGDIQRAVEDASQVFDHAFRGHGGEPCKKCGEYQDHPIHRPPQSY
jgi:hypothetical protein